MPIEFERCRAGGGEIRTKSLPNGKYMHICISKGGGSSVAGEVKTSKAAKVKSKIKSMRKA